MSWQQKNLFSIPLWKLQIDQFGEKKKELIKMLEAYPEEKERKSGDAEKAEKVFAKDATRTFYTNRTMGPSPPDLIKKFYSIIREELENFSTKIDQQFGILDVWSLSYGQGDYHPVHNHSSMGLTGILYLDLPKDSPVTEYVQPWNDFTYDTVGYFAEPVVEGDLVIVPSFILHFSNPNTSDSKKRIISFDLKLLP